jgi:hypothetical protein
MSFSLKVNLTANDGAATKASTRKVATGFGVYVDQFSAGAD